MKKHLFGKVGASLLALSGIAGVEGNGQTKLIEVITGFRKNFKGRIFRKSSWPAKSPRIRSC